MLPFERSIATGALSGWKKNTTLGAGTIHWKKLNLLFQSVLYFQVEY